MHLRGTSLGVVETFIFQRQKYKTKYKWHTQMLASKVTSCVTNQVKVQWLFPLPTGYLTQIQNEPAHSKEKSPKQRGINFLAINSRVIYPTVWSPSLFQQSSTGAVTAASENSEGKTLRASDRSSCWDLLENSPTEAGWPRAARFLFNFAEFVTDSKTVLFARGQADQSGDK